MAYTGKTNWTNNDIVEAVDMNRIEQGITDNDQAIGDTKTDLSNHELRVDNPHAVKAGQVPIADTGSLYDASNVETALAEVMGDLNTHKAESAAHNRKSHRFNITRGATLAGTQTISVLQGTPTKITILAAINDSNKFSIGIYSKFDDKQFCLRAFNMTTAFTSYDYAILMHGASLTDAIIGIITNVTNTSFDINWTISGTPPTGTIDVGVSVDY